MRIFAYWVVSGDIDSLASFFDSEHIHGAHWEAIKSACYGRKPELSRQAWKQEGIATVAISKP